MKVTWTGIGPFEWRPPGSPWWWRFWFHAIGGGAPGIIRYHVIYVPFFKITIKAWHQPRFETIARHGASGGTGHGGPPAD